MLKPAFLQLQGLGLFIAELKTVVKISWLAFLKGRLAVGLQASVNFYKPTTKVDLNCLTTPPIHHQPRTTTHQPRTRLLPSPLLLNYHYPLIHLSTRPYSPVSLPLYSHLVDSVIPGRGGKPSESGSGK